MSEASGDECGGPDYGTSGTWYGSQTDPNDRLDARRQQLTEKQMRIDEKMSLFANDSGFFNTKLCETLKSNFNNQFIQINYSFIYRFT